MIDFDLNGMSARQILAYLKRRQIGVGLLPNINATEKTHRRRPEVLKALREYQIWLAEINKPVEAEIIEEPVSVDLEMEEY